MTPTETATILRQFNEWRRGDEDIPQFDPREIGAAIDAAVELIGRLEAAEKERDALCAEVNVWRRQAEAYWAKIEQMEQQEPVGWLLDGDFYEVKQMSMYKDNEPLQGQTALYALPGAQAQPAPSVPDGWKLVPTAESRHPGIYKMLGALHAADNTPGMSEWESYQVMLAEAPKPEAKP